MPAKKTLLCVVLLILFILFPGEAFAYLTEDFSGNSLNSSLWQGYSNSGNIQIENGVLTLLRSESKSNSFPYVFSNATIFPESGPFSIEIKYKYLSVGNFGDGITISSDEVPPNGADPGTNINSYIAFTVWQDLPKGLLFDKNLCNIDGTKCNQIEFIGPATKQTDLSDHKVKIIFTADGQYQMYFDDNTIPEYISAPGQKRPKKIWIGNSLRTNSNDLWSSFEIDYIKVELLKSRNSIIIVPGLGASWDFGAILTGSSGGNNWTIPSFVKNYDGLINSFKNAGYEEGKNLFVFSYDWRKPLNTLADTLDVYIRENVLTEGKVDIVGHSMGGLVARAYAQKHDTEKIDKILTVGSPNMGTVKAYSPWEGGVLIDESWWGKTALALTTHFGVIVGESNIQTVHRLVPSLKDLLPTYDYLVKNGRTVAWDSMNSKNEYLNDLNRGYATIDPITTTLFSKDIQTNSTINVVSHSYGDLDTWVDGKPTGRNPFTTELGDGTVIERSAVGPFTNTLQGSGWHGELVTKTDNIQKIFGVLGVDQTKVIAGEYDNRTSAFVAALRSPGRLDICNKELTLCNDQLGLYFPEQKLFILPGYDGEQLVVTVSENGQTGKYGLHVADIDKNTSWKVMNGNLQKSGQIDSYIVKDEGGRLSVQTPPRDNDQCKKNWWRDLGSFKFKNLRDCTNFVDKMKWLHNKLHHWWK